jgi:hypothetical protein
MPLELLYGLGKERAKQIYKKKSYKSERWPKSLWVTGHLSFHGDEMIHYFKKIHTSLTFLFAKTFQPQITSQTQMHGRNAERA